MKRILFVFTAVAAIALASCGKKAEDMTPVQPGETVTFRDQVYKFTFKAPKAWVAESTPGVRTTYFSSQASEIRFQKFTEGDYGAMIEVGVRDPGTIDQAIDEFKKNFIIEGATFTGPEQMQLGGVAAQKISFSSGNDENAYVGYRIFTNKDSVVTYFQAATFGKDRMTKYKAVFDLAQSSVTPGYVLKFTPGKIDSATMEQLKKDAAPSPSLANYNGNGYTIGYPDNFNVQATGKGVKFEGDWKGATIIVDVIPSNGSDVGKLAAENAKTNYNGAAVQSASVGSESGKMINYSAAAGYSSRAYFVVRGQNAYRISMNIPKEMDASFRPVFEKVVASFKLK